MFGTGKAFPYVECSACGTLQLEAVPEDLASYYPHTYHSLAPLVPVRDAPLVAWWKRRRALHCLGRWNLPGLLVARLWGEPDYYRWLRGCRATLESTILDVGAGKGRLLLALQREGFSRLCGLEPYLDGDLHYPGGLTIRRGTLAEATGCFAVILLHHVFEHLPEPLTALHHLKRLARPGGRIFLRLPVAGSAAWREYGEHWVQWDAPRHVYLHTPAGLELLAGRAGLRLLHMEWDSEPFQFWGSELYRRGLSGREFSLAHFSRREMAAFRRRTAAVNRACEGDQVCVYLERPSSEHEPSCGPRASDGGGGATTQRLPPSTR